MYNEFLKGEADFVKASPFYLLIILLKLVKIILVLPVIHPFENKKKDGS